MKREIKIHNSLTKKKEIFKPINPPYVGMYVCGPTVYNEVHIGNVRTFICFDVIYRYLTHCGFKVRYVRNITDVGHLQNDADEGEDKISARAKLENLEPMEIVCKYTRIFHRIMDLFNVLPPNIEPTATGHLIEQIEWVKKILDSGFAYEVNGSVYFDVIKYNQKYPYGELSGRNIEELYTQTRELEGTHEKKSPLDFAIWKKASPSHIMQWPSPWGKGFPGWHLECSVMSTKYLGETFDIHGGGMDLKFPHHECEIAQNIAACGNKPANYWIHANMLTINGQKMSKSLGNAFTVTELITGDHPLLEKGYSPMAVRFFILQSHYSSTLDFSNQALQAAEKGFERLSASYQSISNLPVRDKTSFDLDDLMEKCYQAMDDDFNTPVAIAHLFELSKKVKDIKDGKESVSQADKERLQKFFKAFFEDILGLKVEKQETGKFLPEVIKILIDIRNEARKSKNFLLADQIRDRLKESGILLKDGKNETTWEFIH